MTDLVGFLDSRLREHAERTADIIGKLEIVHWCDEVIGSRDLSNYGEFGSLRDDPDALAVTLAVETLRHFATVYDTHADYREEWRPTDAPFTSPMQRKV